jgi:hypothetical protein
LIYLLSNEQEGEHADEIAPNGHHKPKELEYLHPDHTFDGTNLTVHYHMVDENKEYRATKSYKVAEYVVYKLRRFVSPNFYISDFKKINIINFCLYNPNEQESPKSDGSV